MIAPIVFFDIAGEDSKSLKAFYFEVFNWDFSDKSETTIPVISPLPASIRKDPTEKRIYIGVEDVTETIKQIISHGGSIDVDRFEVSGVVVLGLFKDPAGNPMGLVEMKDGEVVVP